jgi:RNA polymerase sigma factor (sigma-70 family)
MTAKQLKEVAFLSQYINIVDSLFLTDRQKQLMNLYYLKGLRYKEIADLMNGSEQTIKNEFVKINKKLQFVNL